MKKWALAAAMMSLLLGFTTGTAEAGVTYKLDCYIVSPGSCNALGFSYGTITITDDLPSLGANQVQVTIDLASTFEMKTVFLNYSFDLNSGNTLTSNSLNIDVSQNGAQANGMNQGKFDLGSKGNINANSHTTVLTATASGATLDAEDFNLLNVNGLLYAAVHLGNANCGVEAILSGACTPSSTATGNQALWVGASKGQSGDVVVPNQVPEPVSFALFGVAAAAMAVRRRRQR